jgi:hypothetical protein
MLLQLTSDPIDSCILPIRCHFSGLQLLHSTKPYSPGTRKNRTVGLLNLDHATDASMGRVFYALLCRVVLCCAVLQNLTKEEIFRANTLGWCIEWVRHTASEPRVPTAMHCLPCLELLTPT